MKEFSCRNCEKRKPGCYDRCEEYLTAKQEYDEAKRKWKEDLFTDGTLARLYKQRNRIHKRKKGE